MHKNIKSLKELKENSSKIKNVNEIHKDNLSITDKIALWITNKVGTFGFFVFTICLTLRPFIIPGLMTAVQFISSAFLQLVLLPLIMIGQNLQSKHSEERAEADFEINTKAEVEIRTILEHLENQNEGIIKIMEKLEQSNPKN